MLHLFWEGIKPYRPKRFLRLVNTISNILMNSRKVSTPELLHRRTSSALRCSDPHPGRIAWGGTALFSVLVFPVTCTVATHARRIYTKTTNLDPLITPPPQKAINLILNVRNSA